MNRYDEAFFSTFIQSSERSASLLLPQILGEIEARSVLDVGCGLGIWLDVAKGLGVSRVHGLDGGDVNPATTRLQADEFTHVDLGEIDPVDPPVDDEYDLAICLEVAEHLPAGAAPRLVRFLCDRAPAVAFGAAIPFQGGTGHVNERWPSYWAELFEAHGYRPVDSVRLAWWSDERISWWYRQNLMLFMSPAALARRPDLVRMDDAPLSLVHPELYLRYADPSSYTVRRAMALVLAATQSAIRRRFHR